MSYNSLGNLRSVPGDVFGHTDSIGRSGKNICFSSKNRLFPTVLGQKWEKFEVGSFHSFLSLEISECHKTPLGIIFKCK